MTANELALLIAKKYKCEKGNKGSNEFMMATEVSNYNSYSRRLDVVVMSTWHSKGFSFHGFEIKVSAADLRAELGNNQKASAFYDCLDKFSLCCPAEILKNVGIETLPKKWGILVPSGEGLRWKRRPLDLHDEPRPDINRGFIAAFISRAFKWGTEIDDINKQLADEYQKGYEQGRKRLGNNTELEHYKAVAENYDALRAAAGLESWETIKPKIMAPYIKLGMAMEYKAKLHTVGLDQIINNANTLKESIEQFNASVGGSND